MSPTAGAAAIRRRGTLLLACGAAAGVALGASGIVVRGPGERVPAGAVAVVNGVPIRLADYERALGGMAADRRDGTVDDSVRRHVLARLIDEELLVQRGLALGLAQRDRRLRADASAAVIGAVVAEAEAETGEPTEAELRTFYAAESDRFRRAGSVRVEQIFFAAAPDAEDAARERAEAGYRRLLGGESFTTVRAASDPEPIPLPDGPLPPAKLVDYLGPTVTRTLLGLAAGGVSAPVRSGWGYHLVRLIAREPAAVPPFEAVRQEVRAEFRRQAGDRRLSRYLDELRAAADIAKVDPLP